MSSEVPSPEPRASPRWRPLSAIERRVLGVLVEKAKTTPENYPLSLNSVRTACNQKNNRAPLMQLDEDQVADALDSLRAAGAVLEIQGDGRVAKYRHLAYEWLGVDKVELAVMAELLLRGSQTVGELRGRAARMEPIKDLAELQPILDALLAKGLIVRLTPPGRGATVTHALYLDQELEKVRREAQAHDLAGGGGQVSAETTMDRGVGSSPATTRSDHRLDHRRSSDAPTLARELQRLGDELAALRADFESTIEQLRRELDELRANQ